MLKLKKALGLPRGGLVMTSLGMDLLENEFKMKLARPIKWPSLEEELKDYLPYFKGKVLNAGAGNRNLAPFIEGRLYNQDVPGGLHNENTHILSPLECIPVKDDAFDSIICNAVLEHVENHDRVLAEFYRILKKDGYLYLAVPFMQGEHKDPTDFRRFTKDGLKDLAERYSFTVIKIEGIHSVYHTLAWIVHEWLSSKHSISHYLLQLILYPILLFKTKYSKTYVDNIASAYRVLCIKK